MVFCDNSPQKIAKCISDRRMEFTPPQSLRHCRSKDASTRGGDGLVAQWCPTLRDLVDRSPPGSSVCGILQERILEWVAMPSSRESSQPRYQTWVSCIAEADSLLSEPPEKPTNTRTKAKNKMKTPVSTSISLRGAR